ncbi:hypothetical protein Tco_1152889 [Tanacetum coccineum]
MNIVVNSSLDKNIFVNVNSFIAMNDSMNYVEMCNKCLKLEAELIKQHNMVEKDEYNRLSKSFSKLEQHCISLELAMQLNKENFQKNNTSTNQTEPSFDHLFELNNLKAELQAKDMTIKKLKAHIKRANETSTSESVKKDFDEIETINIELEHRVTKLIAENKHLKQTYKQLYDSIKPSRVRAKEQTESLVNQVNQKKLKGKDIVDNATQASNATTIAPRMYKLDLVILAPKVKNNREAHEYYLKHTMEQATILREVLSNSGNEQVVKIMGYGDYQIGNVTISRVYYVEGLGHNLFLVGQFCDSDLVVAFRKHTCFVRNQEGVDLLSESRGTNTVLLWSLGYDVYFHRICSKEESLPYLQPTYLKIIETIHVDFDELTAMASEQSSLEPALREMTPATPSSGLVPNPPPSAPFVPPSRKEWDLVFQPVFDEFYSPPASVASLVHVVEAPAPVESTTSPSSTIVDQDAPSPSTSQTTPQSQSQAIPLSAEEESHDLEVAHMSNDLYFGIPIPENYF